MTSAEIAALEDEVERSTAVIIAAEKWAKGYDKDPDSHVKLIKLEAKFERVLRTYFKELASKVDTFINWHEYHRRNVQVQAADDFTVDVVVEQVLDQEDGLLMQVIYEPVETAVFLGATTGENVYKRPLGIGKTTEFIQRAAKERVADLVGKKVDKNGLIIDNPKSKYRISERTRREIRESLNTSLSLREDIPTATKRLQATIKNPKRAELIAQTETVNAYQDGIHEFGLRSGAVGHEWETIGATDVCATNAAQGIIPIDKPFYSGHLKPTAHPRCRCNERLVYPEELEAS